MWLKLPITRKQEKPPGDEDWNSLADEAVPGVTCRVVSTEVMYAP